MKIQTFIVDSFTNQLFSGNPAGICLLEKDLDQTTMQNIAAELNLSETAFIRPFPNEKGNYSIQYFTPTVEIEFCGHATLAAAKVIFEKTSLFEVQFTTNYNLVLKAFKGEENITLYFPLYHTIDHTPDQKLLEAFTVKNICEAKFSEDLNMVIVEVSDKETLANLKPNFQKAGKLSTTISGLIVTCKSDDKKYDFYSRCFGPWIGIDEDPVTGSAHSVLALSWAKKLNKKEMKAYQLSERGGYLDLKIMNDHQLEVRSNACILFEGALTF
ncbi:PhzF family phenazine biosynthesis protein [Aquimarina sp. ERC-38]|uniref:PhzF family phenazine biosynthesis protein n=1 Tax=Aquimarina sp. ERC-38 TaxID=2949996 RepID=UPI002247D373|nr:PhzF family phenazine biosynthesis protein [Aquimarina sp. ERC-38]UZO81620.1 PhzF family phenazine biosynthesis protein [Aquimarina sp. ERC-38]